MRILITGKNGQLGRSIYKIVSADNAADNSGSQDEFVFVGRDELNIESTKNMNDYLVLANIYANNTLYKCNYNDTILKKIRLIINS